MREIDAEGIPVASLSMQKIELKMEGYLKEYHPETLEKKPVPLDVDKLLEVSLFRSHGFREELIIDFDNPKIKARMRPMERTVQITQTCYNRIGANNGYARFNAVHEASHVILHAHQYEEFLINPARMIKRECHTYESAEWQAEHGGGALLMPLKTLIPFLENLVQKRYDFNSIVTVIMDTYKVSKKGAKSRLRQLSKPGLKNIVVAYSHKPEKLFDVLLQGV
jgi:predicted transcriptional regulator